MRAAVAYRNAGYGRPVLIGREDRVLRHLASLGLGRIEGIEIHNARLSGANPKYVDFLYERLQRQRLPAARLPAHGQSGPQRVRRLHGRDRRCRRHGDRPDAFDLGMPGGYRAMPSIRAGPHAFGLTLLLGLRGRTIFIADSQVHFRPDAEQLADIVVRRRRGGAQARARAAGGAVVAFDFRRSAMHPAAAPMLDAVEILDGRKVDFEYDGEMSPDVALEPRIRALYPFCRLTGDANVLVMPGLHSAHITGAADALISVGGTRSGRC